MDFRPIDTTNTITTRNLIRVNAVLNLTLVLVYLSVEPYITAPHMSWLHQMHVLIQPLVLFVSISDSTIITLGSTVAAIIASVFDAVVVWLNYVAISRCFADPTPSCVEILWEKLFFFTLGCVILLSDVLMVLRLFTLQKAMSKKDTHEKASKDEYDSLAIKPAPILRTMLVHNAKMRVIHLFLLPSGILYVFLMIGRAFSSPIYWVTLCHVVLDLYGVGVSKVHDRVSLIILLSLTGICAGGNILGLVLRMSTPNVSLSDDLSYLISVLFIFADLLILYFSISNLSLLGKYDKIKSS